MMILCEICGKHYDNWGLKNGRTYTDGRCDVCKTIRMASEDFAINRVVAHQKVSRKQRAVEPALHR